MFELSPLFFLGGGLLFVLLLAIWQVLCNVSQRENRAFGFAGLTLVALLDVFAFMGGFSIGWAVSLLNVGLGLAFIKLAKHYRLEILFASLISLLLALFLRGYFLPAYEIAEILLTIVGIGAIVKIAQNWTHWREGSVIETTGLAMVACFGFLSLLSNDNPAFASGVAVVAVIVAVLFIIYSRQYRWQFALVSMGCFLWFANLLNA